MRSFNKLLILSSLCVLFVISGCKKQNGYVADNTRSSVTGWSYNDPKEGFFNVKTDYYGKCPQGMVLIDVATSVRGQNSDMLSIRFQEQSITTSLTIFLILTDSLCNFFHWR